MIFEVLSTTIFFLAIVHTFLTPTLFKLSERFKAEKELHPEQWKRYHFLSELFYLLSEVEVVFGIWLLPLLILFAFLRSWEEAIAYLNARTYTHAIYITVILVVIGSRPIITFAERLLKWIAHIGGDTPDAWWWTILTIGPLLGALIKEPAAMALSAILLTKKFYPYNPSKSFQYATLGLLFANISVGGMFTTFASRALFIVADKWEWDTTYMLTHFGWKVLIGLILATGLYHFLYHKEFRKGSFPKTLPALEKEEREHPIPFWVTLIHLIFVVLVVLTSQTTPLFVGVFLFFLGFWKATSFYQSPLHLKSAILVGFFFASLIIHGELQGWWILPLMQSLNNFGAMAVSFLLSAFVDNAIVSYITLDIPHFDDLKHYLVIAGAMSAGALTVIANAPNPIGHALIRPSFKGNVSFFALFVGALPPSLIYLALFWFFR